MIGKQLHFKCKKCGASFDDDESIWIVNVGWPVKLKVDAEGGIAYMQAELQDDEVIERVDLDEIVCENCGEAEVEVFEPAAHKKGE